MILFYSITQNGPKSWVVSQCEKKPFRFRRWKVIGSFDNERSALDCVKRSASFKPHTSFYDKHGTLLVEPVEW